MASAAAARDFFSIPAFAVVGALSHPSKFGHKIFTWYLQHNLPVTPISSSAPSVTTYPTWPPREQQTYPTLASLSLLPNPKNTAVSFITPPPVTIVLLQEAKDLGVSAVWLQPGTFDDKVLEFAHKEFKSVLAGDGGAGSEGWCVLVDGEDAMKAAGRKEWKL